MNELSENLCDCDDLEWDEERENKNDDFDAEDEKRDARAWRCNESDARWLIVIKES